jgi:hypothetical protein
MAAMGHNASNRKRSSAILRAKLIDYAAWQLIVDCGGRDCARLRAYDVAALARLYPEETVSGAIRRMRCSDCACSPSIARMRPKGRGLRLAEDIPLIGAESV